LALEIIGDVGAGDFVFSTGAKGDRPIAGWGKFKRTLDVAARSELRKIAEANGDDDAATVDLPKWHLHDLRHTAATGLAAMGTDRVTISKILNHAEGGITGRYDQYDRLDERRKALDAWAKRLKEIVEPKAPGGNNVVQIAAAARV
jgi:integrase